MSIIVKSVFLGILLFVVSGAWYLIAYNIYADGDKFYIIAPFARGNFQAISAFGLVWNLLVAPLVESIVILLIDILVGKFSIRNWCIRGVIFVLLVCLFGFLGHGGGLTNFGHAIAFLLMAVYFLAVKNRIGVTAAFVAIYIAHLVWNFIGSAFVFYILGARIL